MYSIVYSLFSAAQSESLGLNGSPRERGPVYLGCELFFLRWPPQWFSLSPLDWSVFLCISFWEPALARFYWITERISGNRLSLDIAVVTGMYFCEAWISHFTTSHPTLYEKLFSEANCTARVNPDGFLIYLNPFQTDYCQLEFRFEQVHCVLRFAFVSQSQGAKSIWRNFHIARIFSLCKTCVAPLIIF